MSETNSIVTEDLTDVVRSLARVSQTIGNENPKLQAQIETLARRMPEEGLTEKGAFRNAVAQALQDAERIQQGPVIAPDHAMREEMKERATTQRNLDVSEIRELMAVTGGIRDQSLVDDIRKIARQAAEHGGSPELQEKADELFGAVIKEGVVLGHQTPSHVESIGPRPLDVERQDPKLHPSPGGGDPGERTVKPATAGTSSDAGASRQASQPVPERELEEADTSKASIGSKTEPVQGKKEGAQKHAPQEEQRIILTMPGANAVSRLAAAFHRAPETQDAPVDPAWISKLKQNEEAGRTRREERDLDGAMNAGLRVVKAFEAIRTEPTSEAMKEFQTAAAGDANGAQGVIAEMKEGGKHAGLFAKLAVERGNNQAFAAQMKEASDSLAEYGAKREVADDIGQRRGDSAAIDKRFEKMDAGIAELAGKVPGKDPGSSLVDELSDKAKKIIEKAVEAVKNVFGARNEAAHAPSMGG